MKRAVGPLAGPLREDVGPAPEWSAPEIQYSATSRTTLADSRPGAELRRAAVLDRPGRLARLLGVPERDMRKISAWVAIAAVPTMSRDRGHELTRMRSSRRRGATHHPRDDGRRSAASSPAASSERLAVDGRPTLGPIADVPGVRVGHAGRNGDGWLTGVTVVLPPPGTVGGSTSGAVRPGPTRRTPSTPRRWSRPWTPSS